jgi:hypothetical protein
LRQSLARPLIVDRTSGQAARKRLGARRNGDATMSRATMIARHPIAHASALREEAVEIRP